MASNKRTREIIKMLEGYGFNEFATRANSHMVARHPQLDTDLWFSSTPDDCHAIDQIERDVRRLLGLDNRGRTAVEGKRKQKPKKRQVPQQRTQPPAKIRTLAEVRAGYRRLSDLDRLMRERP